MSSSPSVIRVYGDVLDCLLAAHGETREQWDAPFDAASILPELSKELYECGLNHHQLDVVKEEIADVRLHIPIGIFTTLFRNGHHPQGVMPNPSPNPSKREEHTSMEDCSNFFLSNWTWKANCAMLSSPLSS